MKGIETKKRSTQGSSSRSYFFAFVLLIQFNEHKRQFRAFTGTNAEQMNINNKRNGRSQLSTHQHDFIHK